MSADRPPSRPPFPLAFLLAIVTVAVAISFREAPFLGFVDYDDPIGVLDPHLRGGLTADAVRFAFTAAPLNLWHPLTFLSHALDFEIYGEWGGGHHLTNVLLHLASCFILLVWLRRETGESGLALAVTLLFAIHPLRVESVIWIAERKDVLSLFFYLLVIWFYSEWTRAEGVRRSRFYLFALIAAVLGVLSKPSLMTLPAVLLLADFWPLRRLGWSDLRNGRLLRARIIEKLPFIGLALAAAAVAWSTWSGHQNIAEATDLSLPMRLGFASLGYVSYLQRTFLPVDLVPYLAYPLDASRIVMAGAGIFLAALTGWSLWRSSRSPWLLVGWLWFLGTILPGSGIITISDHFAPDRYSYLAHIGLFMALVWELAAWGRKYRVPSFVGWGALGAVLVALSLLTSRQSGVWQSAERLWRHTLEAKGPNHMAQNQLGVALIHLGRTGEGIAELRSVVDRYPDKPMPRANLSLALARNGEFDEALRLFVEAGPQVPGRGIIREELLRLCVAAGRDDLATGLWEEIVSENPGDFAIRLGSADFLYRTGNLEAALRRYAEAVRIDPDNSKATLSLGAVLIKRGSLDEAIPLIERSIATAPDAAAAADAHRTLAQARLLKREWAPAIASYEKGLALAPDRDLLRNELAQLLLDCPDATLRNPSRALVLVEPFASDPAAKANPRYLRTLARALRANGRADEAKAVATSGLEAVANLSAKVPLEKPWTKEELDSLAEGFRDLAGAPQP
jgi:tetratricopeptide (TPR) repeat protein